MKTIATSCFLIVLFVWNYSCSERATKAERQKTWQDAHFEEHIAVNTHAYDELVKFLEQNADTITSYRRTHGSLGIDNCYTFFQGNTSYDITNVPAFLKAKLDTIYTRLGDENIRQFTICKDKKIMVEVRTDEKEKGLYISHRLLWNTKMETQGGFSNTKDTLLDDNCIYRLEIQQAGH